ncbi:PAS domain S-box protein [Pseudobacillus sp. FSL P4-0506]|uniref:PAS domain S-box protein n=1 Tax=Pseudobacillus sp. FSL P4-0506 TaxID=2921576 RepID=UPI0030F803CA
MLKNEFTYELVNHFDLFIHIFNSMSDLVFLVQVNQGKDFRYLFANAAANRLIGIDETAYGHALDEFLPPETLALVTEKYKEAIKKKVPITYEEELNWPFNNNRKSQSINKDRKGYFESTVTPLFDDQGKCTHLLAIVRDITEQKEKEQELKRVSEHMELIWNHTADVIYTFNASTSFVSVNPAFEHLFGWKSEELLNDPTISIVPKHDRVELEQIIEALKNGQIVLSHEVRRIAKNGQIIHVLASYSPIYDHDGNWDGGVAVYKDVTEQMKIFKKLEDSKERYRIITEYSSDLVKVTDAKGTVIYTSPSHLTILGIEPVDTLNKSILELMYPEDTQLFDHTIRKIVCSQEPQSIEFRRMNAKGDLIWLHTIGTPIINDKKEVEHIIFVAREITERKKYEEKLKQLALYDFLTGKPNRAQFYNRLKKEVKRAKETQSMFSVMMLDLDHFKLINDTMGHDIGDRLLKGFAERVENCLDGKDMLARLGGDEFIVLSPDLWGKEETIDKAERIIESLQKDWEFDEYLFKTTSSIGIAFFPPYRLTYEMLLKQADLALYQAKAKGRNKFQIFQEHMIDH